MKLSHLFQFSTATILALSANESFAKITLFQAEKAPHILDESIVVTESSAPLMGSFFKDDGQNHKSAEVLARDFINTHQDELGIGFIKESDLRLVRSEQTPEGLAFRFSQTHNGVAIEGAEFIALFNVKDELHSVNSSLVATSSLADSAELSKAEAREKAKAHLSIKNIFEDANSNGDLKIAFSKRRPFLVWEFIISDSEAPNPLKVQVIAAGTRRGEILRTLHLATGAKKNSVKIYDASSAILLPNPIYKGVLVLKNGKRRGYGFIHVGKEAKFASKNFRVIKDFYKTAFGRDSYDGQGAPIIASVNALKWTGKVDLLGMRENAAWMSPFKMFTFGAGGRDLGSFAESLDVVAHEFTHAVVETTSALEYRGQSGALNEHLADVFGAMVENHAQPSATPFLIGEKTLRGELKKKAKALRDMLEPHKSLGGQPAHVSEISEQYQPSCEPTRENDNCGVHELNGIPNRAAALVIRALGFDATARLFYRVMTVRLRASSDFEDYRNQIMDECELTMQPEQCTIVKSAFAAVGL